MLRLCTILLRSPANPSLHEQHGLTLKSILSRQLRCVVTSQGMKCSWASRISAPQWLVVSIRGTFKGHGGTGLPSTSEPTQGEEFNF